MTDDLSGTTPSMDRPHRTETDEEDGRQPLQILSSAARNGSLSLAAGAFLGYRAARATSRGRLRALPYAAVAGFAVRTGLRQRRRGDEETGADPWWEESIEIERPDDESTDEGDAGGEGTGKSTSDDAHAAVEDGAVDREGESPPDADDAADLAGEPPGGDVSFVDVDDEDEPLQSQPTAEDRDPRRESDDDSVEIDVSDSAMADEAGEAVGPDPEQSQPTRTEATEPEADADADPTAESPLEGEADDEDDDVGLIDEGDDAGPIDEDDDAGADEDDPLPDGGNADEEGNDRFGQDETDLEPEEADEDSSEADGADGPDA